MFFREISLPRGALYVKTTGELVDFFLENYKEKRTRFFLSMFVRILHEVKAEIEEKSITSKEELLWLAQKEVWSRWKMFLQKIHTYNTPGSRPAEVGQEVLEEKMKKIIPSVYELWKEKEAQPKAAKHHQVPDDGFFHPKDQKPPFYILEEGKEYGELIRMRRGKM